MADRVKFAALLVEYRGRCGWSQGELAVKVGVHRNTIASWETGTIPSRGIVLRLADELLLSKEERKGLLEAAGMKDKHWPAEVWTVPQGEDPVFTGRDEVLASLRRQLIPGGNTQAISGLGGIGKTHTAIEYAHRFFQYYTAVLWLQADSWEILTTGCLQLAAELGLREQETAAEVVTEVTKWLQKHHNWLLVLDNVEKPQEILPRFVPTRHQGSVLVTTRVDDVEPLASTLMLSPLPEQEGILLLLRRSGTVPVQAGREQTNEEQREAAQQIWQLMEGLPLALDQAGAYIRETPHCSFSDYQARYINRREDRVKFLQRRGKRFCGHEMPVVTTFSLALERVEEIDPLAADILRASSMLHGEAIPDELFLKGATHLGKHLAINPDGWGEAMGILRDYSLVLHNRENQAFSVHRLVQTVLQDEMDEQERTQWRWRVVHALNAVFPPVTYEVWKQCERLLTHALLYSTAIADETNGPQLEALLCKAADYLRERAQYAQAESIYKHCLQIREQLVGSSDAQIAPLQEKLATISAEQGNHEQAEKFYLSTLQILKQTQRTEYVELVAHTLYNLANVYKAQGRYAEAEPLYLRAQEIWVQMFGSEHSWISFPIYGLAALYKEQGKYPEAAVLYADCLRIRVQALGKDHPDVAYPLEGLAEVYQIMHRYAEAEELTLWCLRLREDTLGPEHTKIARLCWHLAVIYTEQGRYEQAELYALRAQDLWEQTLGREQTDPALMNLAVISQRQKKYERAERYYRDALQIQERRHTHHPSVAFTLNGLGNSIASKEDMLKPSHASNEPWISMGELWGLLIQQH